MKNGKRIGTLMLTGILCMSAIVGLTACKPKEKTIAVIAKGETHAFWKSVKSGAEAAGKKYGYRITFKGPESESAKDLPKQKEMVQSALSSNPKALVLATIGTGFEDILKQAFDKKIPVVHFDSGIYKADIDLVEAAKKNPIQSLVATSNEKAAAVAAENFYTKSLKAKITATTTGKFVVGIIQHDTTQTGIDRAKGFTDKLNALAKADGLEAKLDIQKEVKDNTAGAYKIALEALYEKGAKAIYMSNEGVVKEVSDAIGAGGAKYDDLVFCGYDAGTLQINWMKKAGNKAKLVGSVAQDSFQIGYQSVEQAVFAIEGKTVTPNVAIGGSWWDSTNVQELMDKNIVYEG